MNSLKSCLLYLCILLTLKVKDTLAVYCSYYDTTANQIRTNFCPQSCCLTAPSIEESCCYSWTWLIILVAFGFPILVGFILMIALCLFYRKRRIGMPYPGGLVMYVDPRRFPASSQHMFQMPMPPPQYNAADMLGVGIENNTTSTTSSGEPPAYTSISESQPPSSSKTTATVAATISNNNNHQAALKSESSGTILSVRSRHESGSRKSKQPVVEASVDTIIPNPASSTPAVALDEIKPSAEIEPSSASAAPRNSTSDAKDDIEIVCVDNQNSVLDGQKTKEEKK